MIRTTLQIKNKSGLSGSTASKVAETINRYTASVQFELRDGMSIYPRSAGAIQILRLQQGDEVYVTADGYDERQVIDALTRLFETEGDMSQQEVRSKIIAELQAGHLGLAMDIVKENAVRLDDELHDEAAKACMGSLKRHFHWMIPSFVQTFGIKDDPRIKHLADRVINLALQHGQLQIADLAAQTFGIHLDDSIKKIIEAELANLARSIKESQIVVIQEEGGEYDFELE